jgi:hypothetical protein
MSPRLLGLSATLLVLMTVPSTRAQMTRPSAQATPWRPSIRVVHVSDTIGRQAKPGVEVILEEWVQSPRGGEELKSTQVGLTDAEGVTRFNRVNVRRGITYVASTLKDGITFSTVPISGFAPRGTLELNTYEQTSSTAELEYAVIAQLDIREAMIMVRLKLKARNISNRVIVATEDAPIRVPMLLPSIGDKPWVGYLPTEKSIANIRLRTDPKRGLLEVSHGGVFFTGPIFPGDRGQDWFVSYGLPIHTATTELGFQSDKPITQLLFAGLWPNSLAPTFDPSLPYDTSKGMQADRIIQRLNIREPPKGGEMVRLRIRGLPYALSAESNLAFFGGGFLFVLFLLFVLSGRRET